MTGVYRFVRNPMYLAVLTIILGQALLFGSWWLVLHAVFVLVAVVAFAKGYEEPTLTHTYGGQYLDYSVAISAATCGDGFRSSRLRRPGLCRPGAPRPSGPRSSPSGTPRLPARR